MGIWVRTATRLEPLLQSLAADLRSARSNEPLRQPLVVVGTRGMERWVLESIARQEGSIAHVDMVFPEKLLQMVELPKSGIDGTDGRRRATWKRERLRWEVLQELRAPHASQDYEALLKLLARGSGGDASTVGRNWVAMATRLADGMERMVFYRPAWVADFRAGTVPKELADWRLEREEGDAVSSWASAYALLVQRLLARRGKLVQEWIEDAEGEPRKPVALSRFGMTKCSVHLFANSAPSPVMLKTLRAISSSRPVYIYVLHPTEAFLDHLDVKKRSRRNTLKVEQFTHPMLFGGGHQTLELRLLLEKLFDDTQQWLEVGPDLEVDAQRATLLALTQNRLAQGMPRGDSGFVAAGQEDRLRRDESILVLKTVDDRRQVEVLRDQLLALFAAGQVSADEVVVMSPRLADFAPLVRQLFDGVGLAAGRNRAPSISYVMVSDLGGEQRPIAAALSLLLEAATGRFDATFCHRWLTLGAVMQAWGLPSDISELATGWFGESNARWGLDEDDRQARVDNVGGRMGMEAGIERMALGLLTGERPEALTERAPAAVAGGVQTRDLAAAAEALDAVASAVRVFREGHGGRSVSAWVESVRGWLGSWFSGKKFTEDRYYVERVMDALAEQSTEAAAVEITAAAFAEVLQAELERVRNQERKQGAGVTFCSLVPMRAIPFKVVVLMGLEAAAFPRKTDDDRLQPLVHLQKGSKQPCDPDASREDRHLFLEAFGMARERFWVIANGFEAKSGEPLAESAPVLELMECVRLLTTSPPKTAEQQDGSEPKLESDSSRVERVPSAAELAALAVLPAAATYRTRARVDERSAPSEVPAAPVEPKMRLPELLQAVWEPLRYFSAKVLRVQLEDEETVDSDDPNGIDYLKQLEECRSWVKDNTKPAARVDVGAAEGEVAAASGADGAVERESEPSDGSLAGGTVGNVEVDIDVDGAADGSAEPSDAALAARRDELERKFAAAGSIAKGYLGLGAAEGLKDRLSSLDTALKALQVKGRLWSDLKGSKSVLRIGEEGEASPSISVGAVTPGGVESLIQPGSLLWSAGEKIPVVVSHTKRQKAVFEAALTLALVRLASPQEPPTGLVYLWWDSTKEQYKRNYCIWPSGLDEGTWLRALVRFRSEAMQRLVVASRELLFDAVRMNLSEPGLCEVLERALVRSSGAPPLFDAVRDGLLLASVKAKPSDAEEEEAGSADDERPEAESGGGAAPFDRKEAGEASGALMDKVAKRVGDAFANAKGFEFPKGLMGGLVQPPYPRPEDAESDAVWATSMHPDVALWCTVVGLPVLLLGTGRAAVADGSRLAVKRLYWVGQDPTGDVLRAEELERAKQQQANRNGKGEA